MPSVKDKILKRVNSQKPDWVCTPKDFCDLGHRASIDQSLSRLAKTGALRRVARGLYVKPRTSALLRGPAPVSLDAAVSAIARRDQVRILPDGMDAANKLGLTNAVMVRPSYVTDGSTRTVHIEGRAVTLRHVVPRRVSKQGTPAAAVVQALLWLGADNLTDQHTLQRLKKSLTPEVVCDLRKRVRDLPDWAIRLVDTLVNEPEAQNDSTV